jgi:hypothetical protein
MILAMIKNAGVVASESDVSVIVKSTTDNGSVVKTLVVERKCGKHLCKASPVPIQSDNVEIDEGQTVETILEHTEETVEAIIVEAVTNTEQFHEPQTVTGVENVDDLNENDINSTLSPAPVLTDEQHGMLYADLSDSCSTWKNKTVTDVKLVLNSCESLSKLKLPELKVLVRFCKHQLNMNITLSGTKSNLLAKMKHVLKLDGDIPQPSSRKRSALSLKALTSRVLHGNSYPKMALNVSYAEWKFPDAVKQWQDSAKVKNGMIIPEVDSDREIEWFYVPEYSTPRNQLEVKNIDPHHLLTRHRIAICKGNVGRAKRHQFVNIASDNNTALKPGMMEQQMNIQSTDFARITFSEKVQRGLEQKGYEESAALCKYVSTII